MEIVASLEQAVRTIPDFPKPGIQFKDITPLLSDPVLLNQVVEALAAPYLNDGVTKVIGIGAILEFIFDRKGLVGQLALFAHRHEARTQAMGQHGPEDEPAHGTDAIEMQVATLPRGARVEISCVAVR